MKRKELIRYLIGNGCHLHRHGLRHDIYLNPKNNKKQPVPRHNEIEDTLIKHIKKFLDIE
ncbi:type II toxin-antitoxin system HicA family toxin [Candidatus Magnetobacterium casensis]|uniref:Type II toxin-antitoxin system HicA family toxin n=1 Tax=Candidatus Magnetobacterium casense TaxID=1455061 RepID=A0ABS6RY54_9BACT|nr:type II toxin-antitoxin system HicA family toxin [Candidatus Magnetobacterium casensis]